MKPEGLQKKFERLYLKKSPPI